ncbi:hypothetical protein CC86DRAFT_352856 [Ophiobolus disseminans]|uniref:Uncharacterized protein n=1 Tax=Ophiobolus disseminans TaxID=1469910 RepID=A0A6A6ZWI9_9PLEO|nr:hypothetical protein CC86DRAFT_352856 [Ophiobolus disseminans]
MRTMTLPLTGGRTIAHSSTSHSSGRASIGGDNRCVIHASTFTERAPAPLDHLDPILASTMPELSSFRPQAADAQGVPRPSLTPARPATRRSSMIARDESPEPAETPSWARSLHLVDTDVSIYKKIHGDEWKDFPLCLHCFRRHGNFNKIEEHGYEVCGREEMLESHYWQ